MLLHLQEERGLADEEARERDALYERAEQLASKLAAIGDALRDAVADVNAGKLLMHLLTGRLRTSRCFRETFLLCPSAEQLISPIHFNNASVYV